MKRDARSAGMNFRCFGDERYYDKLDLTLDLREVSKSFRSKITHKGQIMNNAHLLKR